MPIFLNDILHLSYAEVCNSKIELNMRPGKVSHSFLDLWLEYSDYEKENGLCTECSYWGWYAGKRNFTPGKLVFSFVRISAEEWLFVSAATVLEVPENSRAKVEVEDRFKPLFGRLVVNCRKGQTRERYTFNLGKYLDQITVKEILPCLYSGETFEGYDKVNLPYRRLADMFNGRILPSYYDALKEVQGVYCLTDTKTGKLYIGSATGAEGVAQRWYDYFSTKDGKNSKLIALRKEKGDEYFEEHFTFTLLEYFGMSYDPQKVRDREQYWKHCLDTVAHGYNANY